MSWSDDTRKAAQAARLISFGRDQLLDAMRKCTIADLDEIQAAIVTLITYGRDIDLEVELMRKRYAELAGDGAADAMMVKVRRDAAANRGTDRP